MGTEIPLSLLPEKEREEIKRILEVIREKENEA